MSYQDKIVDFLRGKGFTRSIDIAKAVHGNGATRKMINKDIYDLLKQGKVEKIAEENGGDPRWRLTANVPEKVESRPRDVTRSKPVPEVKKVHCMDCGSTETKKVRCSQCKKYCCEEWHKVCFVVQDDVEDDDVEFECPLCLDCYQTQKSYYPDLASGKKIQRDLHRALKK